MLNMKQRKPLACPDCEGTRVHNQDFIAARACPTCAAQVAVEFSAILRRWLSPREIAEAVRCNTTEPVGSSICHSHDFCDANMAMHEAFCKFGLTPPIEQEDATTWEQSAALWNAAWDLAKAAGFSPALCVPSTGLAVPK